MYKDTHNSLFLQVKWFEIASCSYLTVSDMYAKMQMNSITDDFAHENDDKLALLTISLYLCVEFNR